MRTAAFLLGALLLVGVGVFVVTGTSLIPPTVALGPCLRDWTSPSSYGSRASPLEGVRFKVGGTQGELCYGRPSMRGRIVMGELVPFGEVWRFGANEPTRLYLDGPIELAGMPLAAGRYSLYAIPRPDSWTILASRSVTHWGNDISPAVRALEVGHVNLPVEVLPEAVESLTFAAAPATPDRTDLIFRWERTQVTLPLAVPGTAVPAADPNRETTP